MRYILLIGILFLSSGHLLFAQESNSNTISNVVTVDGISKSELYKRAKIYLAKNYVSSNDVIQFDDNQQDIIIVKAIKHYARPGLFTTQVWGYVHYTLSIEFKEERYRYTYSDMYHESDATGKEVAVNYGSFEKTSTPAFTSKGAWKKFKEKCMNAFKEDGIELENAMKISVVDTHW